MRHLLDTDFIDNLYCFDEYGGIVNVSQYLVQLSKYKRMLNEEYDYYCERNDYASMMEIASEELCIKQLIDELKKAERKIRKCHKER